MPLVIPIFIPHQGCPHTCIFCNQHRISGHKEDALLKPSQVQQIIALWLDRTPEKCIDGVQVAFYGGSFTGLPFSRQQELLDGVAPFLQKGLVQSIRLSTRPDYIDATTVTFLQDHGVATVELGVQSLDDAVLEASDRGHSAADTREAVHLLREGKMEVGLQLMLGLPGQSSYSLIQTAREAVALRPDFVRIYPALVLQESGLHVLYNRGDYRPLSLGKAVVQAAWMKKYFDAHLVKVIRMGLQPGPELEESLVAGPYHPAFGELVSSRIMLQQTRKVLQGEESGLRLELSISDRDVSVFRGLHSGNIRRLEKLGLADRFTMVTDTDQERFTLRKLKTTTADI